MKKDKYTTIGKLLDRNPSAGSPEFQSRLRKMQKRAKELGINLDEFMTWWQAGVAMDKARRPTILPRGTQVDVPKLRYDLCGNRHKLPAGYQVECIMVLYDKRCRVLGEYRIVVIPTPSLDTRKPGWGWQNKSSAHRIFVRRGDRLVPVGRLSQALA